MIGLGTKLEGTPLKIYAYLLKHGPAGPREIARALGLKSPSLAYYHLRKLEAAGLVKKLPGGEYEADPNADIEGFLVIGKWLIPRLQAYAAFYAGMLAVEAYVTWLRITNKEPITPELTALILITTLSLALFLTESLKLTH